MRSVQPLYAKITNGTAINNGRASIASIQELYQGLSLSSQFKVSMHISRGRRGGTSVDDHLTRCGIFDEYRGTSDSYDFFASDTVLPGVNFDMTEMAGAYQGQLEYMPTRRVWPDVEITFYIDKRYNLIRLFEEWMNYINPLHSETGRYSGSIHGQGENGFDNRRSYYKMRYPNKYKRSINITKFERDFLKNPNEIWNGGNYYSKWNHGQTKLSYELIDAFPKQITSIPVSYNASTITQVTVVFGYTRYIITKDDGNRYTSRGSWSNFETNRNSDRLRYGVTGRRDVTYTSGIDVFPNFPRSQPKLDSKTPTELLIERDNRVYGNTFPAGSFGITSKNSSLTSDLKGFKTEPQYDPYAHWR